MASCERNVWLVPRYTQPTAPTVARPSVIAIMSSTRLRPDMRRRSDRLWEWLLMRRSQLRSRREGILAVAPFDDDRDDVVGVHVDGARGVGNRRRKGREPFLAVEQC